MIYNMSRGPSTLYSSLLRRNTNAELQNQLAQATQELSTGVKSDIYKSLGTGAAEALGLKAALDRDAAQISANVLLGGRIDSMSATLGTMRESVQPVLELALVAGAPGSVSPQVLQVQARAAMDDFIAQANQAHAGVALFAGTASGAQSLTPWDEVSAATGQSPASVIGDILGAGIADEAEVAARIDEIDGLFDNDDGSFDALFDFPGSDVPLSAGIGDGQSVNFNVRANDDAFRLVLQGLSMLAAVEAAEIPAGAAYSKWVSTASQRLSAGMEGLLGSQTRLDNASGTVDAANARMEDRVLVYTDRVNDLVGVDSYESATRVTALETQLQASYAVTARLSELSFLNFMR